MPSDNNAEFAFGPRSSPDLVASGELLNTVFLGLEHLRRRLQTAQQNRNAETNRSALKGSYSRTEASTAASAPHASEIVGPAPKYWFYAEEPQAFESLGR
jgi:hypothetical protein